jgi:GSH-dependent disulfide-bond oxidoreductase
MIDFYTAQTSNGQRAAIMLEECELAYTVHKINLQGGENRKPEFLAVNPAGAIPAIVDHDGPDGKRLALAQSGAIVLYLAEKTGRFLPKETARRAQAVQWMMQATTDVAAASAGIFVLSNLAPDKSEANMAFFEERTLKYLRAADQRLADRPYLADELSVADFALYPLCVVRRPLIDRAGDLKNLVRWADELGARSGVQRGMSAAK